MHNNWDWPESRGDILYKTKAFNFQLAVKSVNDKCIIGAAQTFTFISDRLGEF